MAYTPTINFGNARQIDANILAYIAANQTDALSWAKATADDTLIDFKEISDSIGNRNAPIYPALRIVRSTGATDFPDGDMLTSKYSLILEGIIWANAADLSKIVTNAKNYLIALLSMLINIPKTSLLATADGAPPQASNYSVDSLEWDFEELKTNDPQNPTAFIQVFQVRVVYILRQALGA